MKGGSEFITTIGPSWVAVHGRDDTRPGQPFVGIRVERGDVWVACELQIAGQPIASDARAELERLFDQPGRDAWLDEHVLLFHTTYVPEALCLAEGAVSILRRHGLRQVPGTSAADTEVSSPSEDLE